jgi:2-keto-3-deoxy-L-rhamnonate aldolase RhmA
MADTDFCINHLKRKLAKGEVAASMIVRMARGPEIGRIAAGAGMDTLYVDLEHCSLSIETTSSICIAAQDAGVTPLVRVPRISSDMIGRVLDGGAMGIIAPHIGSADDARRVVRLARFAPLGERSVASNSPQLRYRSVSLVEAARILNAETLVGVMVEGLQALEAIDEIAAVEGVDLLLIGAGDLSTEMGIPGQMTDPRMVQAVERIIDACVRHGKACGLGGLGGHPDLLKKFVQRGARYVSTGSDLGFLQAAIAQKARFVRDAAAG